MSLLVYGVVGADGTAVIGTGIDERPLRGVSTGRLMAIVTGHDAPGLEVVCTGPWPPYSFADGGALRSTS